MPQPKRGRATLTEFSGTEEVLANVAKKVPYNVEQESNSREVGEKKRLITIHLESCHRRSADDKSGAAVRQGNC